MSGLQYDVGTDEHRDAATLDELEAFCKAEGIEFKQPMPWLRLLDAVRAFDRPVRWHGLEGWSWTVHPDGGTYVTHPRAHTKIRAGLHATDHGLALKDDPDRRRLDEERG